jgi:regulator of replication initiation timing
MNTREIEAEVQRIERAIKEREREIAELKVMLRDLWTERTVNRLLYRDHRSRGLSL